MTLAQAITKITSTIVNPLILLMFGLALLIFVWGCIQYIRSGDDPTARADGVRNFTYGIIGMAIMMSAFSIAKVVQSQLPKNTSEYTSGYVAPNIDSLKQGSQ